MLKNVLEGLSFSPNAGHRQANADMWLVYKNWFVTESLVSWVEQRLGRSCGRGCHQWWAKPENFEERGWVWSESRLQVCLADPWWELKSTESQAAGNCRQWETRVSKHRARKRFQGEEIVGWAWLHKLWSGTSLELRPCLHSCEDEQLLAAQAWRRKMQKERAWRKIQILFRMETEIEVRRGQPNSAWKTIKGRK